MTLRCHLFNLDHTPAEGDAAATYTGNEAAYSGYASQLLPAFGAAFTDLSDGNRFVCAATAALTYSYGAAGATDSVYGYYWTDDADGEVLLAQRFGSAPIDMSLPGDSITFTPQLSERSEFT